MLSVLLDWPVASAILRHALTVAAGVLVSKGYLAAGDTEALIGAALGLVGVVWSIVEKRGRG